jgi:outer membrane protein, heavy metal efflux system
MVRRMLLLSGLLLVSGCAWPVRQTTDKTVCDLVNHPFDIAPDGAAEAAKSADAPKGDAAPSASRSGQKKVAVPEVPTDAQTSAWLGEQPDPARRRMPLKDDAVRTASWMQPQPRPSNLGPEPKTPDLHIPPRLPGSEAPEISIPSDPAAAAPVIDRLYPELPPLPVEPPVQPGPDGKPYTLADFQRLAAANSPTLRQAVSDVEAAKGEVIQAKTYPNPVLSYLVDPSNNNSTAGVQGGAIEQIIKTGGKQKLGVAAAQKDLDNALLALKRARSDLSTAVRTAYFTVLVDVETLIVTRAVAQFTDDVYRIQTGLLKGAQAAPYEPASLRAQSYLNRLAYKQAIFSYIYDWKSLVATTGLQQLPLSEIAGRVDRFFPYYDYDEVLAHALKNHTDILTARNGVVKAQHLLRLAQVLPLFPDLDVRASLEKDFALAPFGTYQTLSVGFPIPIFDQNKGNIISAQAALVRAGEESHRVEVTIANNLAMAYQTYKNNLVALEDYRRTILPDMVRYYRGIFSRRQLDPTSAFGDLVAAQQTLTANVTAYITVLGSLWTSVVGVADFLQTDDLYQLATKRELPELPDFTKLCLLTCGHAGLAEGCLNGAGVGGHGAAPADTPAPLPPPEGGVPVGPASSVPAAPPGAAVPLSPATEGVPGAPSSSRPAASPPKAGSGTTQQPPSPGVAPPAARRPADQVAPTTPTSPFGAGLDRMLAPQSLLEKKPTPPWVLEAGWDRVLAAQADPDPVPAAVAK